MKEFFLKDYRAKSNSAVDDSSDIYPSRFRQTSWNSAHGSSVGDISFGFVNSGGPITSFARELGEDTLYAHGQLAQWPGLSERYSDSSGDNDFRISWGDEGQPSEGWYPWWDGYIMVRDERRSSYNLYPIITSPNDEAYITDTTPVVTGTATRPGNIITVSGPQNQRCNATVDSARRWSCTLSPSLLNGRHNICVVEREGSRTSSTVRVDVNINNVPINPVPTPIPVPVSTLTIFAPLNGATLDTHNPAIIGTGTPGSTVQVAAVGKNCTTTVLSNGGWTCTLTLLPAGSYSVVATQYNSYGGVPTGTATTSFTILGAQCPVFSQYHKLGQSGGEIPKIQEFLHKQGYYRGAISGYYDFATDQAIRSFQLEFRSLILDPWRLTAPTGNWYKTSRKHANFLSGCYETVYLEDIGINY